MAETIAEKMPSYYIEDRVMRFRVLKDLGEELAGK